MVTLRWTFLSSIFQFFLYGNISFIPDSQFPVGRDELKNVVTRNHSFPFFVHTVMRLIQHIPRHAIPYNIINQSPVQFSSAAYSISKRHGGSPAWRPSFPAYLPTWFTLHTYRHRHTHTCTHSFHHRLVFHKLENKKTKKHTKKWRTKAQTIHTPHTYQTSPT